jgi:hypothetical protein
MIGPGRTLAETTDSSVASGFVLPDLHSSTGHRQFRRPDDGDRLGTKRSRPLRSNIRDTLEQMFDWFADIL